MLLYFVFLSSWHRRRKAEYTPTHPEGAAYDGPASLDDTERGPTDPVDDVDDNASEDGAGSTAPIVRF